MTAPATPRGFVSALNTIRRSTKPLRLYFHVRDYRCLVRAPSQGRPEGAVLVGTYDAFVLGTDLARIARKDLDEVIFKADAVPRATRNTARLINELQEKYGGMPRRWLG